MHIIKQLEPHTTHEAGTCLHLPFRRAFGSFRQQQAQPQRVPEATRAYQHGDPLRSIDWRAYARSEQLLVNQQQHGTCAEVVIAVSCLPSMCWPPADLHHDGVPKLEIAMRVALHLAFVHSKILDRVTLYLVSDQLHTRQLSGVTEVLDLYENFCAVNFVYERLLRVCTFADGGTDVAQLKGDAKYWLGDGLREDFKFFLRDVPFGCFVHTLSAYELSSAWFDNDSSYFALAREVLGKNLRRIFRPRLTQWLSATEREVVDNGNNYLLLTDNTPIAHYLNFLNSNLSYVA